MSELKTTKAERAVLARFARAAMNDGYGKLRCAVKLDGFESGWTSESTDAEPLSRLLIDVEALLARVRELEALVEELRTPDMFWDAVEPELAEDGDPWNILFDQQDSFNPDEETEIRCARYLPSRLYKIEYDKDGVMSGHNHRIKPEGTNDKA